MNGLYEQHGTYVLGSTFTLHQELSQKITMVFFFTLVMGVKHTSWCLLRPWFMIFCKKGGIKVVNHQKVSVWPISMIYTSSSSMLGKCSWDKWFRYQCCSGLDQERDGAKEKLEGQLKLGWKKLWYYGIFWNNCNVLADSHIKLFLIITLWC